MSEATPPAVVKPAKSLDITGRADVQATVIFGGQVVMLGAKLSLTMTQTGTTLQPADSETVKAELTYKANVVFTIEQSNVKLLPKPTGPVPVPLDPPGTSVVPV